MASYTMTARTTLTNRTKVVRIPRRYNYLHRSFTAYLNTLPADKLWKIEESLAVATEEDDREKAIALMSKFFPFISH